jgi:GH24 family phage-related lysozyme (muramidase)
MRNRFEVVKQQLHINEAGENTSYNGHTCVDYYIRDTKTNEVRLLDECILCDVEVLTVAEFKTLEVV